eukprot:TRINITY_DN1916_c0_g1_i1.p1 TRINITY_DN1916_c0_g1~~TRINITY_DN1916_c0_g1_i1.p1  ORF type:complete len:593 (-),score=92.60 TRINITY_DN1916_c0_g1_i1:1878-3656(-)
MTGNLKIGEAIVKLFSCCSERREPHPKMGASNQKMEYGAVANDDKHFQLKDNGTQIHVDPHKRHTTNQKGQQHMQQPDIPQISSIKHQLQQQSDQNRASNMAERSQSLPATQITPFAESETNIQSSPESTLNASQSDDLLRQISRKNQSINQSGPYIGWRSEQGYRAYQEDRCVGQLQFYNTQRSYRPPKQSIPSGLMKYSGLQKEPSVDYTTVLPGQVQAHCFHYFAVFDGHGGDLTSKFCQEHMAAILEEKLKTNLSDIYSIASVELGVDHSQENVAYVSEDEFVNVDAELNGEEQGERPGRLTESKEDSYGLDQDVMDDPEQYDQIEKSLIEAFIRTDDLFSKQAFENQQMSGSTALVMLLSQHSIYVGNVGDSRAVLCRNGEALPLSDDHKADRVDEVKRVQELGGHVLHWNGMRVMGVLAMSRAIGDAQLKPYIIPKPEVTVVHRKKQDQLVIMASDGLWDVFDNQEACVLALKILYRAHRLDKSRLQATKIAASVLAKTAISRGSRDNVTVLVVDLKPKDQHITKEEVQVAIKQYTKRAQEEDMQIVDSTNTIMEEFKSKSLEREEGGERGSIPPSPFARPVQTTE